MRIEDPLFVGILLRIDPVPKTFQYSWLVISTELRIMTASSSTCSGRGG
jgi:hypothetical protein